MVEGDKVDAVEGEGGSLGKGFLHWMAFFGWMGVGYLKLDLVITSTSLPFQRFTTDVTERHLKEI